MYTIGNSHKYMHPIPCSLIGGGLGPGCPINIPGSIMPGPNVTFPNRSPSHLYFYKTDNENEVLIFSLRHGSSCIHVSTSTMGMQNCNIQR